MDSFHQNPPKIGYIDGGEDRYFIGHSEDPWLSIKCMFNGPARYETGDGGQFIVDDGAYLILNAHQPYWIRKETGRPVESFCLFFAPGWADDVLRSLTRPDDQLLDNPLCETQSTTYFLEKRYAHDNLVTPYLLYIRDNIRNGLADRTWLEEACHHLLGAMLQTQRNVYHEVEQLPLIRYATRVELYYRLHRAKDFMHAYLDQSLPISMLAQTAYLSPHHFLRSFKQVFGQTPHAYLTEQRLKRAQDLLKKSDQSITNICLDVGFQSVSSFSLRFRRQYGVSPRAFRQQNKTN